MISYCICSGDWASIRITLRTTIFSNQQFFYTLTEIKVCMIYYINKNLKYVRCVLVATGLQLVDNKDTISTILKINLF